MRLLVVGAGQVGRTVAESLARDHEVVVMDLDPERLDRVRSQTDVMTYDGDGTSIEDLKNVNTEDVDTVVASTNDDQTNILICNTARALNSSVQTIARVKETGFLQSWQHSHRAFNVSFMVGADHLTALDIFRVSGLRSARDVELFCRGQIEMAEFDIPPESSIVGQTVREADRFEGLTFAAVFTGDTMEVVRGNTTIRAEDRLLVIGLPEHVQEFGRALDGTSNGEEASRIVILGGGEIGRQTAKLLQKRGVEPKLVEQNSERAEFLAKDLPGTLVLEEDATDPEFLKSEGITRTQLLVAALRPDERNLLTSLLGKQLGAERVVSVVHDQKYESLFEQSGIDVVVNPRREVIEEILQYIRGPDVEKIAFVEHHQGEVIEIELRAESSLVGRPLKKSMDDFPKSMVIGAISRKNNIITPRGDTVPEAGDHVVLFADTEELDEVLDSIW